MKLIELNEANDIELWPGRRLFYRDKDDNPVIVGLPRGAMRVAVHGRRAHVYFGSTERTGLQLSGNHTRVGALADAIVELERPKEGTRAIG